MGTKNTSIRVAVAAAAGATALLTLGTGSAQALPGPNGSVQQLAMVGSDTTFSFMGTYARAYNANTTFNRDHDVLINIAAKPTVNQTIPAEGRCATARTYGLNHLPPDGSGAGRKALYGTDGLAENVHNPATACLDIARSSGARDTTDPTTAQFFAYAKDAVSYAYFGAGPANLRQADLKAIYTCSKTNWSQIAGSGKTGTIHRYLPQAGSGTRDFFLKTVLGGVVVAPASATCPLDQTVQENTGTAIPATVRNLAILPYSVGQWVVQNKTGGTADKTAGNKIGAINGVKPASGDGATAAPNAAAILNGTFLGSRFLYNVVDTRLPSYGQALRAIGADNTGSSPLCNGSWAPALRNAGFVPLPSAATGGGISRASSCRRS